jgi:very-short-patch-repair endonuclease
MLELEELMPPKVSTPKIMQRAGELRQNQTEAEAKLWSRLRAHQMAGVQFRRQHAIGKYIVDFPKGALCVFTPPKTDR